MHPIIPVFIASPTDVQTERNSVKETVQRLSKRLVPLFGVALNPVSWDDFAPLSAPDATVPQRDILRRIEPSSIFIGILYRRYGTEIPSLKLSGTEIEFNHAIENRRYIRILSLFSRSTKRKDCALD
jgi:hypothetical protein